MKKNQVITILLLFSFITYGIAQEQGYKPSDFFKVIPKIDKTTPLWAVKMYSTNPNVDEVDRLYRNYYKTNAFQKTIHTQNYKHWRWQIEKYVDDNGFVTIPSRIEEDAQHLKIKNRYLQRQNAPESSNPWYAMGPFMTYAENSITISFE